MSDLDAIMYIETEENQTPEGYAAAFQALIDSGTVWSLQGFYGRTATDLIAQGVCHR